MADLEEHAFKRDKRFVVRLVVLLMLGGLAGIWVAMKLTSAGTASCAANLFGGVAQVDAGTAAP